MLDLEPVKANIVQIIQKYVPLTQKGQNFVGVCPFHPDSSPSLIVSPGKKIWSCYPCGFTGRDAIDFVSRIEGVDFKGAVKQCGLEVSAKRAKSGRAKETLRKRDELEKKKVEYLRRIDKEFDALCKRSYKLTKKFSSTQPMEREADWFTEDEWLNAAMDKLEATRRHIVEIAEKKKKEVI